MSKVNWDATNIPDQKGKVIVVTGATSGIGKQAAKVLALKNGKVILAVRNTDKGDKTAEEFRSEYNKADVEVRKLDLSKLNSVRAFAKGFSKDYKQLDVLINNAGVMMPPFSKTEDGFELQFGTNHLGHFALTGLLLPLLKKTKDSRIVVVSSSAHAFGNINFDDLTWENRRYITHRAYGDSKIANLYFTYELARRLKDEGGNPRVTAAHPGWTATDLQRHAGVLMFLNKILAQSIEMGTLPTLRAAYDEQANPGDFFGPKGLTHMRGYPQVQKSNALSNDESIAKKLWTVSEELTGVTY